VNVLYFADTRFPIERANGVQTMATCHALATRGHQVTLVTRPDSAPVQRDPFAFYDWPRIDSLRFHYVPRGRGGRAGRVAFFLAASGLYARHPGAAVYTRDLGLAAFLLQKPSLKRPRVVFEAHGVTALVSRELPDLLGRPDLAPSKAKLHRLDRRERRVWKKAAACVTITRTLADDLAARHGQRDHVFVAPDGGKGSGPARRKAGLTPSARPVAGYAGHLYPWKGVDVFIRALMHAPGVSGLIVGGHPGEADLARVKALVEELGLAGRVTLTGLVPPGEVAARLEAATMLVLPNTASAISERYTSPLKLFEYLGLGRPIIASDLPAIREVLAADTTALLIPPGDAEALGAAMVRLTEDPALAASLGSAAQSLMPEYTWEARAVRLEAALEAALS
jgi:glycosyltransferase involved in cell wall biosynthesis